jgi:hypothetical protein
MVIVLNIFDNCHIKTIWSLLIFLFFQLKSMFYNRFSFLFHESLFAISYIFHHKNGVKSFVMQVMDITLWSKYKTGNNCMHWRTELYKEIHYWLESVYLYENLSLFLCVYRIQEEKKAYIYALQGVIESKE